MTTHPHPPHEGHDHDHSHTHEHEHVHAHAPEGDEPERAVLIIGVGPDARAVAEMLELYDRVVYGFVAATQVPDTAEIHHIPVLGRLSDGPYRELLKSEQVDYVIAEPSAADRIRLLSELVALTGRLPLSVAHPSAYLSPTADIAAGVIIEAGCVISAGVKVEAMTHVGVGCLIDTDAEIGRACTLQLGARLGRKVTVEDEAFVGAGAQVHEGIRIEKGARVGAGSLVMRTVRTGESVFGVPAQPITAS